MDDVIINNLKSKIKSEDTLYFLGDLTFNKQMAQEFFEQFSYIHIHFIIGNHDHSKVIKITQTYCESVSYLKDVQIHHQAITLCHYAMRVWNKSHFNAWQLYGHSHGGISPVGKQYDVGVDNNNFFPISFDDLIEIMNSRPNNFNFIPSETIKEKNKN